MGSNMLVLAFLVLCCSLGSYGGIVNQICTNCYPNSMSDIFFPGDTNYLVLLKNNSVIKSVDEGSTWQKKFDGIRKIRQFPNNPDYIVMYTQDAQTIVCSGDGGDSFAIRRLPDTLPTALSEAGLVLHPTNPGWMVFYHKSYDALGNVTKDFGDTWTPFNSTIKVITNAMWSNNPNNPDNYFAIYDAVNGSSSVFGYTQDYGVTWVPLVYNAVSFYQTDHFLFVTVNLGSQGIRLFANSVYNDPSHTDPSQYNLVEFPFGGIVLKEMGYEFLDDTSNSEIVGVFTNASIPIGGQTFGSVFYSDFNGEYFVSSLSMVSIKYSIYDFELITSLKGVFLANQMSPKSSSQLVSVISFDNGGDWRPLTPPAFDSSGNPINCSLANGCSLHIHGYPSWYFDGIPYFVSAPNAVGIIIANGNYGPSLSQDLTKIGTYLSRDGGLTWKMLWNTTTVYDIGDHGGLIVFAPLGTQPTKDIYYTTDEGVTIVPIYNAFNNMSVRVTEIIADTSGVSRKFIALGETAGTQKQNFMYSLDFTSVFNTPCDPVNDFEMWSPSSGGNDSLCFMGATTVYARRKANSACFTNIDEHVISNTPCACAFEDYECDIGFTPSRRNTTDGFLCTPTNASDVPSCATGYRLVPGTQCKGGLNLNSQNCPGYSLATLTITSTGASTGASSTAGVTSGGSVASTSSATGTPTTFVATSSSASSSGTITYPTSTTSGPAVTTTSGKHHGGGAGKAVGLTFLFLILGAAAVVGVLYWKHPRFKDWVDTKLNRNRGTEYERINNDF